MSLPEKIYPLIADKSLEGYSEESIKFNGLENIAHVMKMGFHILELC